MKRKAPASAPNNVPVVKKLKGVHTPLLTPPDDHNGQNNKSSVAQPTTANRIPQDSMPVESVPYILDDKDDDLYQVSLIRIVNEQFKIVRANPGPKDDESKGTWDLALQELDQCTSEHAYKAAVKRLDDFFLNNPAGQARKRKMGDGFANSRRFLIRQLANEIFAGRARDSGRSETHSYIRMFDSPQFRLCVSHGEVKSVGSQWQTSWFLLAVFAINIFVFLNPRILLKLLFGTWLGSGLASEDIGVRDFRSLVDKTQRKYLGNATKYFDRLREPSRIAACLSNRSSLEPLWSWETAGDFGHSTLLLLAVVLFFYCLFQLAVNVLRVSTWALDRIASMLQTSVSGSCGQSLARLFVVMGVFWSLLKIVSTIYAIPALNYLSNVVAMLVVGFYALLVLKKVLRRTSYGSAMETTVKGDLTRIILYLVACLLLWCQNVRMWGEWTTGQRQCQEYLMHRGGVSASLPTESWRAMSAIWIHGSWTHLVLNMWALVGFQNQALVTAYGNLDMVVGYLFCGLSSSVCSYLGGSGLHTVGASGPLYGVMTFSHLYFSNIVGPNTRRGKNFLNALAASIMVEVALCCVRTTDESRVVGVLAHVLINRVLTDLPLPSWIDGASWIASMAGTFLFSAAICVLMPHGNIDHFAHVGGVLGGFVCYVVLTPNHQIPLRLPQDPNPHPHIVRHGSFDSKLFRRSQMSNKPPPLFHPHEIAKLILGTVLLVVMMRFAEQADWIAADINIFSIGQFFQTAEGDGTGLFGSAIVGMAVMRSKAVIRRKTRWHLEPLRSKMQAAITAVRRDGVLNSVAAKAHEIPARTLRRYVEASRDPARKNSPFYHPPYEGETWPKKTKRCSLCDQGYRGACTHAAVERVHWKSVKSETTARPTMHHGAQQTQSYLMELMQQPQPLPPFPWQPTDQCGTRYGTTPPPKSFATAQQNPPDLPARPNIPRVQSLPFRPDMSRVQSLLFNDEIFLQFVDDELLVPQDPTSAASTPVVASQPAPVSVPQVPSTSAPAPVVAPAPPVPAPVMSTQHPASPPSPLSVSSESAAQMSTDFYSQPNSEVMSPPQQQPPPQQPPPKPRVQSLPFRPDMSRVQSLLFNDETFLQFVDDKLLVPQDPASAASTPVVASQPAPVSVPQVPSTSAPAPVVAPALPPPVSVMSTQHPASSLQPSCSLDDVQLSNFVDDMLSDFHDEGFVF